MSEDHFDDSIPPAVAGAENVGKRFLRWLASYLLLCVLTIGILMLIELVRYQELLPEKNRGTLLLAILFTALWATAPPPTGLLVSPFSVRGRKRKSRKAKAD